MPCWGGYKSPEDLIGQNGLLKQLTKALVERARQAELTDHLGHGKNQLDANQAGNTRNERSQKKLKGDFGELPIHIPRDRAGFTPFFDYPPEIRKIIYTTNAIESVNISLRKITKTCGLFPTDDAVFKLFYLALNNISQKWTMPIRDWKAALNRFIIQFDESIPRE
jgi:transposase-like protein